MHDAHVSEVMLTLTSDMKESIDDSRTKLHFHANMAIIGSSYSVFESTGRTCNV